MPSYVHLLYYISITLVILYIVFLIVYDRCRPRRPDDLVWDSNRVKASTSNASSMRKARAYEPVQPIIETDQNMMRSGTFTKDYARSKPSKEWIIKPS